MPRAITIVPKPPKLEQKKRVAAYARVSSGKDAMLHSLSAQVSYYSDLIQNHDDWLYVGVYADEAKTGTKESRADFQRLIADCRAGKIDMVITKSISRFARNTVTLWQQRPLEGIYAVVFLDAIHYHVRSEGQIVKKAVYIAIGIDLDGKKDVLGMWVGENESAKFWATVLNSLKNRGVEGLSQILCKHREAVQNRAKIIYGGSGVSCCRLVYKITAV